MSPLTNDALPALSNQTRVDQPMPSHLVKTDPEREAASREPQRVGNTEANLDSVPDEPLEAPKSKLPIVIGVVSLLLIGVGGFVLFAPNSNSPTTKAPEPIEVKPEPIKPVEPAKVVVEPEKPPEPIKVVEPVKTPEPVKPPEPVKVVEPVKPPEPVKVVEPVKAVEKKPEVAKPVAKGITQQQLEARLARVEAKLQKREADMGDQDRMLRNFLKGAKAAVQSATDDASRKEAWKQLAEIEDQLR